MHWRLARKAQIWQVAEAASRRTPFDSVLTVDTTHTVSVLETEDTKNRQCEQTVEITLSDNRIVPMFRPGEHQIIKLKPDTNGTRLNFRSEPRIPGEH